MSVHDKFQQGASPVDVDSANHVLEHMRIEHLPSDTTVLVFPHTIQVYLRNGVRVVFNVELAFADKPE